MPADETDETQGHANKKSERSSETSVTERRRDQFRVSMVYGAGPRVCMSTASSERRERDETTTSTNFPLPQRPAIAAAAVFAIYLI